MMTEYDYQPDGMKFRIRAGDQCTDWMPCPTDDTPVKGMLITEAGGKMRFVRTIDELEKLRGV